MSARYKEWVWPLRQEGGRVAPSASHREHHWQKQHASKTQWGVFVAAVRAFCDRGGPTRRAPNRLTRCHFSGCVSRRRAVCGGLVEMIAADAVVGAAAAFALEAVVVAPVVVKPQPQKKEAD